MPQDHTKPWLRLNDLIQSGDATATESFLDTLSPSDTARAIGRLDEEEHKQLFDLISAEDAAELIGDLPEEQAADLVEELTPHKGAEILDELPDDEVADILAEVHDEEAEAILKAMEAMDPEEAERARQLLQYGEDTAGGIMITEYLSFQETNSVSEVMENLRAHRETYSDYEVQYGYVTSASGSLRGVLKLRDILLATPDTLVSTLMIDDPVRTDVDTPLEDLVDFFEETHFLGLPVIDKNAHLVGVIRKAAVMEATERRSKDTFLKVSGIVGGEEFRTMPLGTRITKRLSWLLPSMILLIVAAWIIAKNETIIKEYALLAALLPVVSGMCGNSGNQSMAVSIRELTLGIIRPTEAFLVFLKEAFLGLTIGAIIGTLLGTVAALYSGNQTLGFVIAISLSLNMLFSVIFGGIIPLFLKRIGFDPALASGPIVFTCTDMFGFFLVLTIARLLLM